MARRVFFSFHFEDDSVRANQVRNSNVVAGADLAGFFDHSEYTEAKSKGEENVKRLIRDKLHNTTVTVVLIGTQTASRPFVQYEIEQSLIRKNGLVGIHIHNLQDFAKQTSPRGRVPTVSSTVEFPCYDWDQDLNRFRLAIEAAGTRSDVWRARGW